MRIRDLEGWPPPLSESYSSDVIPANPEPATLKGCKVYPATKGEPARLAIIVHYRGRDWRSAIANLPVPLLKRIEATFRGHEGEPIAKLGGLEILESV
jgi:hypothetical protein